MYCSGTCKAKGMKANVAWWVKQNKPHPMLGKTSPLNGKTMEEIMGGKELAEERKKNMGLKISVVKKALYKYNTRIFTFRS